MSEAASLRYSRDHAALGEKPGQFGMPVHIPRLTENLTSSNRFSQTTYALERSKVARMSRPTQSAVAKRLRAVRCYLGKESITAMAAWLDVPRTRYANWENENGSGNFPAEEAIADLCDRVPGLTMDYIYRGRLDGMPLALAINLTAWEMGSDPSAPGFDLAPVTAAVMARATAA